MDAKRVRSIVERWMFPTEGGSYMGGLESRPVLARSKGSIVVDTNGKEYLDFQSGQMGAALGHQHPRIVAVIENTMKSMMHASNTMLNVPRLKLHERLGKLLPKPLEKSLFLVSGSDSIEASIDLARKATGGLDVVGFHAALHGSTSYLTRSVTFNWDRRNHSIVAPATQSILTPYCYRCPLNLKFPGCGLQCLKTSLEMADANFTSKPAAFIGEPILSAGGVIVPPPGYFTRLTELAHERGMLVILDECQTGLGRLGAMYGFEVYGIVPDFLVLSKTLGGGVPISAVVTSSAIDETCHERGMMHATSHISDPMPAAAALAVLDVVEEERLADAARERGDQLLARLTELQARHEAIGDVRGMGLLTAIELVEDRDNRRPALALGAAFTDECERCGLSVNLVRGRAGGAANCVRMAPPLTISEDEIDLAVTIMDEALTTVAAAQPA